MGHITDQISEATLGRGLFIISLHSIFADVVCRTHASLQGVACFVQCHVQACNLSEAELDNHMMCAHADVRSCTCGHHLSSHRRVARVLANVRQPCRHAVQTYVCRTRSLHHHGMPRTEYTPACWCGTPHLVTLDALLASRREFCSQSHAAVCGCESCSPANKLGRETWFTDIQKRP